MDRVLNAVAADDARLLPVEFLAELLAFGVEARTGHPAEALGHDRPADLDLQGLSPNRRQPEALEAEPVLGSFVAVAVDLEPGLATHEFRQIEGDHTGIVGEEPDLVDGPELDQGDRPAASLLHD